MFFRVKGLALVFGFSVEGISLNVHSVGVWMQSASNEAFLGGVHYMSCLRYPASPGAKYVLGKL
jgi:hypothetical protein